MQLTTSTLALVAAATSIASAAPTPNAVIGPFALKLQSSNSSYNDQYLSGIHIGAAIDLAVPSGAPNKNFYLNGTESYEQDGVQYGTLHYNVNYPQTPYVGGLAIDASSNVAQLWLSVVYEQSDFSFDNSSRLLLGGLSRWVGCTSLTSYGPKLAINWVLGTSAPSTDDCVPVTIVKA